MHEPSAVLAFVLVLGVGSQLLAQRLRVPAIIFLLITGLAAGPGLGLVDPDELAGRLLFDGVAMAVALLLFEGGLSLRYRELGRSRATLLRMLTLGAAVTAVVATTAAIVFTDLPTRVCVLFGSIMVVTGPTVIGPLLRQTRLRPRVGRLLRWEGIFIDPVGAVLGVTVLEAILSDNASIGEVALRLLAGSAWGVAVGLVAAALLVMALERHLIADHLENPLVVVLVLATYAASNAVFHESGLYATTVLGVALANQRRTPIRHLVEFQESLSSLTIAAVFVLLAARVRAEELRSNLLPALGILVVLVLVARPLSIWASTFGSRLTRKERLYLAGIAPRGIVAASVSALFGLKLEEAGVPGAASLSAITFLVVAGTVIVYGLGARSLARVLRVAEPEPVGVALIGSPPWVVGLARTLADAGVPVLVITTVEEHAAGARDAGLLVYDGRLEDEALAEALSGVGVKIAITVSGSEELDAFAVERLVPLLGRANVYRLPRDDDEAEAHRNGTSGTGRQPFGGRMTQSDVATYVAAGGRFRLIDGAHDQSEAHYPFLALREGESPELLSADFTPRPGDDRIVVLASPGAVSPATPT